MREALVELLKCIACNDGSLTVDVRKREDDVITAGFLGCTGCGAIYPIVAGVPRITDTVETEHSQFYAAYSVKLPGLNVGRENPTTWRTRQGFNYQLAGAKGVTAQDVRLNLTHYTSHNFFSATETNPETAEAAFSGKRFLDIGMGGGHYSFAAIKFGAEVISVDINDSGLLRYAAAASDIARQHVVQASALRLPLRDEIIDYSWSMGVLHHTDDLLTGLTEMARVTRIGGSLNLGVYGRYRFWQYYCAVRKITMRLPLDAVYQFARLVALISYLPRLSFLCHPWVERSEPFQSRVTGAFDHFHPPIQGYYPPEEVRSWLEELGCFEKIYVVPNWNSTRATKISTLTKNFSAQIRANLMRC